MARYVAFLRAVNVAGHAVLKKEDLQRVFQEAGCTKVQTVIQSGNVIFEAERAPSEGLFAAVREGLAGLVGMDVLVIFRRAGEILNLAASGAFSKAKPEGDAKRYACFLSGRPRSIPKLPLISAKDGLGLLGVTEGEAFVISRKIEGKAMYGFPNAFIEKRLSVGATTRSWSTVLKIAGLLSGEPQG